MPTFIYEITSTNRPDNVPVGTLLVDTAHDAAQRGTPRTWHLFDAVTGDMPIGWSGVVLHRVCGPCRDMATLRAHGHNGRHGKYGSEPELTPQRLSSKSKQEATR
jgi:hypothetical protein